MRTVTNCFLLNLAAADLVFALGVPAVAFTRISQDWRLGNIFCKILPYSQVSELAIMRWLIIIVARERISRDDKARSMPICGAAPLAAIYG